MLHRENRFCRSPFDYIEGRHELLLLEVMVKRWQPPVDTSISVLRYGLLPYLHAKIQSP